MDLTPRRIVLASASTARAVLLRDAGVEFAIDPADIDEAAIKSEYQARYEEAASSCALALAGAKAAVVARRHPEALVIGADQLLVCAGEWFDKPRDLTEAADQLRRLRGRDHILVTAACLYENEKKLWQAISVPRLTMRRFGDAFLAGYIAAEGKTVLGSVGAYRIEGRGVQLFGRIEGDHFAILGLPLLELLGCLREHGVVGE
ncbi:MAG TPA: Maf family nucleotide pyrophosphatase [Stellaceae bacterium]|jgi:septum formation protein|nr:Maf family nucleotide pyrophosphatase [Stellaceae bacterium]